MTNHLLWAPQAWIAGAWQHDVLLRVGSNGCWAEVQANQPAPAAAQVLPGPVLPGLVDAHSHAFQRAFVGLAERRDGAQDDFWSWRTRMYGVALRITPAQLRAVATQLYTELLRGGYTQVCEFHYLHHSESGAPYADPLAMSRALVDAAATAGIGLTLLPVLYQRAGFDQATLRGDQRRFAADLPQVLALRDGVRALGAPRVSAGVAVHSLRAVPEASLRDLVRRLGDDAGPVHIHIAEQTAEVDDCVAATGAPAGASAPSMGDTLPTRTGMGQSRAAAGVTAMRAIFMPCSPSGMAQPIIASSMRLVSIPGAWAQTAFNTWASISSGRVLRNMPRGALPTGVRVAATI